ncbi:MAG: hypothetical protein DDT18_00590 [Actinobacteria bacterium]|nr:hypothetical protein [Actinomycetota bacterium]
MLKSKSLQQIALSSLANFTLSTYECHIKMLQDSYLPLYEGSMLRGAFGGILRGICCAGRLSAPCSECPLVHSCAYAYIFETSPQEDATYFSFNKQVPRPYIFEPPDDGKTDYAAGETFTFRFILIGNARKFIPYFIYSFHELGKVGITRRGHKFFLDSIYVLNELDGNREQVFSGKESLVYNVDYPITVEQIQHRAEQMGGVGSLTLRFITPLRLKCQSQLQLRTVPLSCLLQNLSIKTQMLNIFHCQGQFSESLRDLVKEAQEIEPIAQDLRWRRVERYSLRRQQSDTLSGLVGTITYKAPKGELARYLPLLILGQFIHVGGKTVFGLGKYVVEV